jgi:hypothetical protein
MGGKGQIRPVECTRRNMPQPACKATTLPFQDSWRLSEEGGRLDERKWPAAKSGVFLGCGLYYSVAVKERDKLEAAGHFEFVKDRSEVVPNRRLADIEALGNFLVLQSIANQGSDLALSRRQRGNPFRLRIELVEPSRASYANDDIRGQSAIKPRLACMHLLDGPAQLVGGSILVNETNGAELHGALVHCRIAGSSKDNDARTQGHAVLAREEVKSGKGLLPINIQKHNVGRLAARESLQIVSTAYFADDFHSRPAFDQHPDARTHDYMVVDEQNSNGLNHYRGSRSRPG